MRLTELSAICADMAAFYREIGWNWGRAWLLAAKAGPLMK
jgi:hypothetical protein